MTTLIDFFRFQNQLYRFHYIIYSAIKILPKIMDPIKNTSVVILFSMIGGVNHIFIIPFSYWYSITTNKNAIVSRHKIQNCKSVPMFINQGSLSSRDKRLSWYYTELRTSSEFTSERGMVVCWDWILGWYDIINRVQTNRKNQQE